MLTTYSQIAIMCLHKQRPPGGFIVQQICQMLRIIPLQHVFMGRVLGKHPFKQSGKNGQKVTEHLKHKPLHLIYKHFHYSILAYIILHLKCPFKLHFQLPAELCVEAFVCLIQVFPLFQKLSFPHYNTKNSLSVNCSVKESTLGLY